MNNHKLSEVASKNVNCFSLDLLPRITRAQSMDILSSQANLAGYKAVVDSLLIFKSYTNDDDCSWDNFSCESFNFRWCCWITSDSYCKKNGCDSFATDVRSASKEQVEGLGGKFLTVEGAENLETEGGYAKEASEDFKKKQEELLKETLKKIDIVICCLDTWKKSTNNNKKEMINVMSSGSIIYDLAASQGGNSELTKVDQVIDSNGVQTMGEKNILNKLPVSASNLYSKNMYNFVNNLYDKEKKTFEINLGRNNRENNG